VAAVAVALGLLVVAAGWYYSGEIREGALEARSPSAPRYEVEVLSVEPNTVSLKRHPPVEELVADGVWGLRTRDGYGQISRFERVRGDRVVRRYAHVAGVRPQRGDRAQLEAAAFPPDPRSGLGLDHEEIRYDSDLGPTPAWLVPGRRATWVVFVHGLNAPRSEALRLLRPVAREGYPALVISYRNDPGAPRSESGRRDWGRSEWRDVEAAVRYALDHGAAQVALVGYSMGGAVVTSFLYESDLAGAAVGAVLDSPALDFGDVVALEARQRTVPVLDAPIPSPLTEVAKTLTSWRFDVDWDRVDYVERAEELQTPALLLHGTADATVPFATSAAFARARPDLVTLVGFAGAGHVRAWNVDRSRYERRVLAFLRDARAGGT
jgi:alpha-beta hydrolase superfamily lysophospholipase